MIERYEYQLNKARNIPVWWRNLSGGENIAKTGPNSPARYPLRPFPPALKPILERFVFVKLSGFRGWSPTQQVDPHGIGASGAGPGAGSPQAKKKRAEAREQ